MKSKIIAAASLAAVAVVVIAAVVVVNPFGASQTAGGGEESMHSEGMAALGSSQTAGGGEESMHSEGMAALTVSADAKPYIGVAISETDSGAAKVVDVLEYGPSRGVLEAGDLITAVEGEALGGARDLVDAIADAGAGAALALTVERDGGTVDLSVSVGEMSEDDAGQVRRYAYSRTFDLPKDAFPMKPGADFDVDVYRKFGDMDALDKFGGVNIPDMFGEFGGADMFGKFSDMDALDKFGGAGDFGFSADLWGEGGGVARVEKSAVGEDGEFRTHRAVMGTVTEVDADAGTFTLQPRDGSAEITYAMTEDSKTLISGYGRLGGLSADGETPTVVMDVDGEVELVAQGGFD